MTSTITAAPTAAPTPRRRLPMWAGVLLAMLMMLGNYIVTIPLAVALQGVLPKSEQVQLLANIVGSVVTLATALVWVWLASHKVSRLTLADVGLRFTKRSPLWFLAGWAIASVGMLVAQLLPVLPGLASRTNPHYSSLSGVPLTTMFLVVLASIGSAVVLQGLPEELVFRGWLMRSYADRPRTILVASAVFFASLHLVSSGGQQNLGEVFLYLLTPLGFGFLAGALALRFRSLWTAVGVHGGMHLTDSLLPFTGLTHDGPAFWVVEAACWMVLGLVVLHGWKGERVEYDS